MKRAILLGTVAALAVSSGGIFAAGGVTPLVQMIFRAAGTGAADRTLLSKLRDTVSVKDFGAVGDGVTDDTAAIQAATAAMVAIGKGSIYFPPGTYILGSRVASANSGIHFVGADPDATTIKASSSFSCPGGASTCALFVLGNDGGSGSTAVTTVMGLRGMSMDLNAKAGVSGLAIFGLRDGSSFEDIRITNFVTTAVITGTAGALTGDATGKMNQGVQFRNVHATTFQGMTGVPIWRLDGIFESQLIGCKAIGSGWPLGVGHDTDAAVNVVGYDIARNSEVRGLALIGSSVANILGGGNAGIQYGNYARDSWDEFTTFEEIMGPAVYFHGGNFLATTLPFNCQSLHPRIYTLVTAGHLDPVYRFGDAAACRAGPVVYYRTDKVWARFDAPVFAQANNIMEVFGGVDPASLSPTNISFDAASSSSNVVTGFSSADSVRKPFTLTRLQQGDFTLQQRRAPTYGPSIAIDASTGNQFVITATDGVAFTIGSPSNSRSGMRLTIRIRNTSGGALGAITWGGTYKMAAWTSPATANSRAIDFQYDGTNWIEVARTAADVPN